MSEPFHSKLAYTLKALSLTRAGLAAELEVDKSVIGRWVRGAVRPSTHNLARLSERIGRRVPGFRVLDWERSTASLANLFGADPSTAPAAQAPPSPTFPLMAQSLAVTAIRGRVYEGFFRTTRPYAQHPGAFVHDHVMMRLDATGVLDFQMANEGVRVVGTVMLLENKLFVVSSDVTSGVMAFAVLNGVGNVLAERLDGVILYCALDAARTPTATVVVAERIGQLCGDRALDDAHFATLAQANGLADPLAIAPEILTHLSRAAEADLTAGSEWLISVPLARSLSGGVAPPL